MSSTGACAARSFDLTFAGQRTSPRCSSATSSAVASPCCCARWLAAGEPAPPGPGCAFDPHPANTPAIVSASIERMICMIAAPALLALLLIDHPLHVLVELEQHDHQLAPDARADRAAE